MACCKCNRTGRCRNCACVKAGKSCHTCFPSHLGHCLNTATARPDATPVAAASVPEAPAAVGSVPMTPVLLTPPPPPPTEFAFAQVPTTAQSQQTSGALNRTAPLIDAHQPHGASYTSTVSWPLPALQKANFMWGSKDGPTFCQNICSAYEHVIHWNPNLFLPHSGVAGKNFVQELARLLQAYADSSSLECIAMKGIVVMQHLLLQKPLRKYKGKECAKHLQRRLDLWLSGEVDVLLSEGDCIQKHLGSSQPSLKKSTPAQSFAKKMKQGNVKSALNSLFMSSTGGGF